MGLVICSPQRLYGIFLAALCLSLLGCGVNISPSSSLAGAQFKGRLHGGQQPVTGATIQLYAAGTAGYGSSATPLLPSPMISDATGSFSITADYTCPSSTSQLYLVATGGNPGLAPGTNNAAIALMAALGPCSLHGGQLTLDPNEFILINEVTTVASVYSLSAFMGGDAAHIGASSTNAIGLANSFGLVNNLVNTSTGSALQYPAPGVTAPQAGVNTLANILASCVNSDGTGPSCTALFAAATPSGGTAPTDTIQAIYNISRNPANNVNALLGLATAMAPFQPSLSYWPDLTLVLTYPPHPNQSPTSMAIDASGDVWFINPASGSLPYSVSEISSNGTVLSGTNGYTAGGLGSPYSIAIDPSGNVWVTSDTPSGAVSKFSSTGSVLSGSNGFTWGSGPLGLLGIALDGQGNAWMVANQNGSLGLAELDNNGNLLSPAAGFSNGAAGPPTSGLAIDRAGNVWTANGSQSVSELSNNGTVLSGTGYPVSGLEPLTIAIDGSGNAWVNTNAGVGNNQNSVGKLSPSGVELSPVNGYSNCVDAPPTTCVWWGNDPFALDGAGNVWGGLRGEIPNGGGPPTFVSGISEMSNTGTIQSGPMGYGSLSGNVAPSQIAIDGSGNVWALSSGYTYELVGAATPVVTPFSVGVKNGTLGSRP